MDKDLKQISRTKPYSYSSKKILALSFVAALQAASCVSGRQQALIHTRFNSYIDLSRLPEGSSEFKDVQHCTAGTVSEQFAEPNAKLGKKHEKLGKSNAKNAIRQAIDKGDLKLLQLLLNEKSIDPNAVGNGLTSLVLALKHKSEKLAYLLLEDKRINITTPDPESGLTPLHLAIQRRFNHGAIKLVRQLSSEGLSAQDNLGRTPLYIAIQYRRRDIIMLLANKLPVEALYMQDCNGMPPLDLAIIYNDIDTVKLLVGKKLPSKELAAGLLLALQDDDTKLVFRYKHQKIVDLLLREGKISQNDLLIKDYKGRTLLSLAIECGDINAVELLVSKLLPEGLFEKDNKGRTPLELAARNNNEEAFKLLFDKIVVHLGKNKAIASLFNEGACSVFAYAYLSKHRYVASLLNNSHVQTPTFFFGGYKIFKHIIETVSGSLTFDQFMTIANEIDDIEYGGGLSRLYARSLRCLIKPYIEKKSVESGVKISRYTFYKEKEKE